MLKSKIDLVAMYKKQDEYNEELKYQLTASINTQIQRFNALESSIKRDAKQQKRKGIGTGTSTTTRVGNKVKSVYIKGSITLTANQENNTDDQGGEEVVNNAVNGLQYLRTTWRVVIVKDTQSNSTDPQITWDQVFTSGVVKTNEEVGGINSELNIGNMGRFVILSDQYIELSAENPQKTVKFVIPGSKVGSVRYNGPSDTALTDKGVYVIAANQSTGLYTSATVAYPGLCAVQSRFCFVDD